MKIIPDWLKRPPILAAETPKGPWGAGNDAPDGPRNPWSVPPGGKRPAEGSKPTALDEFLKRARGTAGGGGGGGMPHLPGGANARTLWMIGVGVIVVVWLLFSSIHPIGPQQRGIITSFGRYSGTLDPGIRLTLPAPISSVQKLDVQKIRTEDFPRDGSENLMLTGDRNIIDLAYSVRWDISSPRDFAFQLAEPEETVRATAETAMRAVVATTTLNDAIGAGRNTLEARVQQAMQGILDDYSAGVRVQGVSIKQASAPASLIDDFNAVTAAQQEAIGNLNNARSYSEQVVARAQGEAASFDKVYAEYRLAPEVTRRRMYYETMEAVLARTDKTIVEPTGIAPFLPLDRRRIPNTAATTPTPPAGTAPAPTPAAPQEGQR